MLMPLSQKPVSVQAIPIALLNRPSCLLAKTIILNYAITAAGFRVLGRKAKKYHLR
jgi:hypothetical protein